MTLKKNKLELAAKKRTKKLKPCEKKNIKCMKIMFYKNNKMLKILMMVRKYFIFIDLFRFGRSR